MCCGTEAGSYLRLIDSCITQFKVQGPSRTCNESKEEEEEVENRGVGEHEVLPEARHREVPRFHAYCLLLLIKQ